MRMDRAGQGDALPLQAELARRLNLLLDVVAAERGKPVTFREVQSELEARGIKLSRARWFYMKEGTGRLVSDPELLAGLCSIFNVDPSYLFGDAAELPKRIDSQLESGGLPSKALRAVKFRFSTFPRSGAEGSGDETGRLVLEGVSAGLWPSSAYSQPDRPVTAQAPTSSSVAARDHLILPPK